MTSLLVAEDALIPRFADDISTSVVSESAGRRPLRAVLLHCRFASDAGLINTEQMFRGVSSATDIRAI